MKKILTISFLVITILMGGMTMEAKTTKKNSKAKTTQKAGQSSSSTLGIMTFCVKGDKYVGPGAKSVNEMISALKKLGFKYEESYNSTVQQYDEEDDEYYDEDAKVEVYSNKGVTASIYIRIYNGQKEMNNWPYQVDLMFDSTSQENNFISTVKANGFSGQNMDDGIMYYSRKQPCGVSVKKTIGADEMIQISFFDSH